MIIVNMDKAKKIGHELRRVARAKEFAPFDDIVAKQIPEETSEKAEEERRKIRSKYENIQIEIDAARTPDEIKTALGL